LDQLESWKFSAVVYKDDEAYAVLEDYMFVVFDLPGQAAVNRTRELRCSRSARDLMEFCCFFPIIPPKLGHVLGCFVFAMANASL